ncbi:hypothetical protein EDD18DRAFT_1111136 [Armillaria luteobubalina]|uniref:Uncharacterized protein n=1 Tax=Armillaria luteobubalina TaxID=153913 RepID=A0AA39UGS4_9AGAR|nr:hypothetical protein EDD18DRAFT_1111136 [Armillaria luteobubalina]
MSWIVGGPPSPIPDNSPVEGQPSNQREIIWPLYRLQRALGLAVEQWSMIPLPIKSVFSTAGIGIQSVSSPACGMEWCFNLDLLATSGGKKVEKCAKKSVGTPEGDDINTVRMGASFLSIPAGFQPGTILWGKIWIVLAGGFPVILLLAEHRPSTIGRTDQQAE